MAATTDRLESWKEISAYLERTERTCQRWELRYALPIRRFSASPRSRVYAFKGELDNWFDRKLGKTEGREARDRLRRWTRRPQAGTVVSPDVPAVSNSPVANKAYQAGRNAKERFLVTRNPTDIATAVEMYKKVVDVDPGCALGYYGLGDAYRWDYSFQGMKPDRLTRMTESYAKAFEMNPELAETNIGLGWSRYFAGDTAGASACFNRAAKIKPDDPEINLEIGSFLFGLGHPDRAARRFTKVLSVSPFLPRVLWLRALCREWTGDYKRALADGTKALEFEPASGYLRCMQARLMILSGNLAEGEAELSIAETLSQGTGDVEFTSALLWAARGDRKRAEGALSHPGRETALRSCIETMVHAALGDRDQTIAVIARTIETGFPKLVSHPYPYPYLATPNNHFYDPLRKDPRFLEILARQKQRHREESARLGAL